MLSDTEVGDQVCVSQGMRIPVISRPQGERWEFIGACYVQDLIGGEVWSLNGLEWDFMNFVKIEIRSVFVLVLSFLTLIPPYAEVSRQLKAYNIRLVLRPK